MVYYYLPINCKTKILKHPFKTVTKMRCVGLTKKKYLSSWKEQLDVSSQATGSESPLSFTTSTAITVSSRHPPGSVT